MVTKTDKYGRYLLPSDPQNAVAVRTRLSGDRATAATLANYIHKRFVPKFIQAGKFQNLQQNQKVLRYPNGEVAHIRSVFGIVMVDVYAPPTIVAPSAPEEEKPVLEEKQKHWEDWDGSNSSICVDHTWRVGMTDPGLYRHEWAYCDGSFTLDPPTFHASYPDVPAHHVDVTGLYWLDLSGGELTSSFWREPAGSESIGYINYRSSYMEWQASLDTVQPTLHEGGRAIQFDISTEFEGLPEGDYLPNKSFIAVELTDVNTNFVRLYFKADPAYLTAIGQSAFLIGDGLVDVDFEDWGLDSDIVKLLLLNYSDFSDSDRVSKYTLKYIDIF